VKFIGASIKRLEDPRLLAGGGRYVDDLARPGTVHAVVVRSPQRARARSAGGRAAALAQPGVLACLTAADLAGVPKIPLRQPGKPAHAAYLQPPLAGDRVRYAGQPIAVVVATDRVAAVDARELVEIEYDVLPAHIDTDEAGPASVPRRQRGDSWSTTLGDVDAALRGAARVVKRAILRRAPDRRADGDSRTARRMGRAREPPDRLGHDEGPLLQSPDARRPCWGSTRRGSTSRNPTSAAGFGARGEFYPKTFLIPYLARRLDRPVKWVEDRREHFLAINHSREQQWSVVAAADERGRLLALDATLINVMAATSARTASGRPRSPRRICPAPTSAELSLRVSCVMTSKTPTGTVRAPGFYEGTFVRERSSICSPHGRGSIRPRCAVAISPRPTTSPTRSARSPPRSPGGPPTSRARTSARCSSTR